MPAANVTAKDVPKLIALQFEKSKSRPQKPQFEVGDQVRIAVKNMPFRKGYKQQYTNEVFKVHQVCKPKKTGLATTYRLEDIKGEPIYNVRDSYFDFYWDVGGKKWVKNCKFERGVYNDVQEIIDEMNRSIHRAQGAWNKEKLKVYFSWKIDAENKFVLNYPNTVKFADMSPDLFHILGCQRVTSPWKHPPHFHDMPPISQLIFSIGIKFTCMAIS